jgi:hypothetical protein
VQFIESEEQTLLIAGVAVSQNHKYIACIEQTSVGVSTQVSDQGSCYHANIQHHKTLMHKQVSVYSVQHAKRVKTILLENLAPGKDSSPVDIGFR